MWRSGIYVCSFSSSFFLSFFSLLSLSAIAVLRSQFCPVFRHKKQVSSRSAVNVCWLVGLGLVWLVAVALSGSTCAAEATTARTQVSDEALDKALSDKRYLMRQLKCALGEVACDPVGKRLKSKYHTHISQCTAFCQQTGGKEVTANKKSSAECRKLGRRVGSTVSGLV